MLGKKFGRLTVISAALPGKTKGGKNIPRWNCDCECGNTKIASGVSLRRLHTRSCGCLWRDNLRNCHVTHGRSKTIEYVVWRNMLARCYSKKTGCYPSYGGRGIKVCEAWRKNFARFLSDVGFKPSARHSLDRIDNDGDYEPGNVRWTTLYVQARNTRKNRVITHNGKSLCLADWANETGINIRTLHSRLGILGWSTERAFSTPPSFSNGNRGR